MKPSLTEILLGILTGLLIFGASYSTAKLVVTKHGDGPVESFELKADMWPKKDATVWIRRFVDSELGVACYQLVRKDYAGRGKAGYETLGCSPTK